MKFNECRCKQTSQSTIPNYHPRKLFHSPALSIPVPTSPPKATTVLISLRRLVGNHPFHSGFSLKLCSYQLSPPFLPPLEIWSRSGQEICWLLLLWSLFSSPQSAERGLLHFLDGKDLNGISRDLWPWFTVTSRIVSIRPAWLLIARGGLEFTKPLLGKA